MSIFNSNLRDDLYEKIEELKQQLAKQEKIIELLAKSNEFYADIDSWEHLTTESIKYVKILLCDYGDGDFYKGNTDDSNVGGKLARDIQRQVKELEDKHE